MSTIHKRFYMTHIKCRLDPPEISSSMPKRLQTIEHLHHLIVIVKSIFTSDGDIGIISPYEKGILKTDLKRLIHIISTSIRECRPSPSGLRKVKEDIEKQSLASVSGSGLIRDRGIPLPTEPQFIDNMKSGLLELLLYLDEGISSNSNLRLISTEDFQSFGKFRMLGGLTMLLKGFRWERQLSRRSAWLALRLSTLSWPILSSEQIISDLSFLGSLNLDVSEYSGGDLIGEQIPHRVLASSDQIKGMVVPSSWIEDTETVTNVSKRSYLQEGDLLSCAGRIGWNVTGVQLLGHDRFEYYRERTKIVVGSGSGLILEGSTYVKSKEHGIICRVVSYPGHCVNGLQPVNGMIELISSPSKELIVGGMHVGRLTKMVSLDAVNYIIKQLPCPLNRAVNMIKDDKKRAATAWLSIISYPDQEWVFDTDDGKLIFNRRDLVGLSRRRRSDFLPHIKIPIFESLSGLYREVTRDRGKVFDLDTIKGRVVSQQQEVFVCVVTLFMVIRGQRAVSLAGMDCILNLGKRDTDSGLCYNFGIELVTLRNLGLLVEDGITTKVSIMERSKYLKSVSNGTYTVSESRTECIAVTGVVANRRAHILSEAEGRVVTKICTNVEATGDMVQMNRRYKSYEIEWLMSRHPNLIKHLCSALGVYSSKSDTEEIRFPNKMIRGVIISAILATGEFKEEILASLAVSKENTKSPARMYSGTHYSESEKRNTLDDQYKTERGISRSKGVKEVNIKNSICRRSRKVVSENRARRHKMSRNVKGCSGASMSMKISVKRGVKKGSQRKKRKVENANTCNSNKIKTKENSHHTRPMKGNNSLIICSCKGLRTSSVAVKYVSRSCYNNANTVLTYWDQLWKPATKMKTRLWRLMDYYGDISIANC